MITEEQINSAAENFANKIVEESKGWMQERLEPKWIEIKSIDDLPEKSATYFVCQKTWYAPGYQINPFCGRLRNAVDVNTGEPIFSHYMVFEPELPKTLHNE